MFGSCDVIAFVQTCNVAQAKAFYGDVLGLDFRGDEPSALVFDAHGTMLRISKVRQFTPTAQTVLGWNVPNIRAAAMDLKNKGVSFQRYEGLSQDELGVWESPGNAKVAWFKDPDGNTLSITEFT